MGVRAAVAAADGSGPTRVARDALARSAERRRLTTLVAAPGWDKTALVTAWARDRDVHRLRLTDAHADPDRLRAELREAPDDVPLLVTHAEHLAATTAVDVLHDEIWAGRRTPAVVVSQHDLGLVDARARASGDVLELDATHLAYDAEQVERLVAAELGPDRALATRLLAVTSGWPAPVRLLVDACRAVPDGNRAAAIPALTRASGPVGSYLREVVLPTLDPDAHRTLAQLALLDQADADELAVVLDTDRDDAERTVDQLRRRGLVDRQMPGAGPVRVPPVLAEVVRADRSVADDLIAEVADGLLAERASGRALALLLDVGDHQRVAQVLDVRGTELLHAGHLDLVARAVDRLPARMLRPTHHLLAGQALAFRGDWAAALEHLAAAGTEREGPLTTVEALGLGLVHHLRGDLETAVAAYGRGPDAEDTPTHACLTAWRATAHWLRGELDTCRRLADAAMAAATRHRDPRALALAHTAAALLAASDGDRRTNEAHYRQALAAAERADDQLQQARLHTNVGSLHLEQGEYETSLEHSERAVGLASAQGFAMIHGIAACNRAEALLKLGRVDESIADAEAAREVLAAAGSAHESYAHHLLGDARRERGELALARQAYERSLRLAEPGADRQGRVPALVGLARTLVGEDDTAAEDAARRGLQLDDGMQRAELQLALGWIARSRGDHEQAAECVAAGRATAAARENHHALAEAATLEATLADDPVPGLRAALQLWQQVGATLAITRVELGVARRSPDPSERARADGLARQLAGWGGGDGRAAYAHRVVVGADRRPATAVRVLGPFVVERHGEPVARSAWRSRKARELLQVLVVRGGRPIAREELAELLWPDTPYSEVSNRLSVALSVVRNVLGGKDGDGDAIDADGDRVALQADRVDVDVDRFRRLAEDGLAAVRAGDPRRAIASLSEAVRAYTGDLLEEDRDALWLLDRREELRATSLTAARTLADLVAADDPDTAVRLLLRVLDRDPYDEPAHLAVCAALLRAGRHGEARRRHRLYADRMEELELPAVPFDAVRSRHLPRLRDVSA